MESWLNHAGHTIPSMPKHIIMVKHG